MRELKRGDPVIVHDFGLIMLQKFTKKSYNLGWVNEIRENGDIVVEFLIGDEDPDRFFLSAPYKPWEVTYDEGTRLFPASDYFEKKLII